MTYRKTQVTIVHGHTPEELAKRITLKLKSLPIRYNGQGYKLESVESMADGEGGYVSFVLYSYDAPGDIDFFPQGPEGIEE